MQLLGASKTRTVEEIKCALQVGLQKFGENYVQEAIPKIQALSKENIEWHFIGPIQSNKTQLIARYFSWVQSVDRLKIAERLNEQRPVDMSPIQLCIEVNVDCEPSKSGVVIEDVLALASQIIKMPHLKLRGLMAIPTFQADFNEQRSAFKKLHDLFIDMQDKGFELDTLSMGMTHDFEVAIAEGSTLIRIGEGIFGPRS